MARDIDERINDARKDLNMPRNVRNFWIELTVDGKAQRIACGPQARDGGFELTVKMRDKGDIVTALHVSGRALQDGTLQTEARADAEVWRVGDSDIIVSTER